MKPRSWIKTMAASALLSPRAAFRKANSNPSSLNTGTAALPISIPLAILATLTRVIEFLDENHFDEEGLYSKPGVGVECKDLLGFVRDQKLPDLSAYSPHSIASIVKEILSDLYTPLIPAATSEQLLEAVPGGRIDDEAEHKITEIFKQIRSTTRDFLQVFLGHLNHVYSSGKSRMSVTNLALHGGIALVRPTEDKAILSSKNMMRRRKCVVEFLIREAASLPYDCVTEMNIPAIPELASIPATDPQDSSSPPPPSEQLHFVQVTWHAGKSSFTPEQLEAIFGKFGEIENLGINDQGNRAIIAYVSAASAEEAEYASIPCVRVRRRKPRQSEKRREYFSLSAKSNSRLLSDSDALSGTDCNPEPKENLPAKQTAAPSKLGSTAIPSRIEILDVSSDLTLETVPLVQVRQTEATYLDSSIIIEDIEDDQHQPADDTSDLITADLHLQHDGDLLQTQVHDLQANTDANSPNLNECLSPKVESAIKKPSKAEQNKRTSDQQHESNEPDYGLGADVGAKMEDVTQVVPATEVQDVHRDIIGGLQSSNSTTEKSKTDQKHSEHSLIEHWPTKKSIPVDSPLDTLAAVSTDSSQPESSIDNIEPAEVKPVVTERSLDLVIEPGLRPHSFDSLETSMVPLTDQDGPLTSMDSTDNAFIMDTLQSKLLDMEKVLNTSTAALSTTKLPSEFERAVLQLHNQILSLVADCLVLGGVKHGDLSGKSMTTTTSNAEFLDFLEAQSKTQVKILEIEVRAGQELLRLHKTQYKKERVEFEDEITALRVSRTEAEKLCAELRADLRKCRSELACHVANATDIQRQKSALEEKLAACENQLHAREKALTKLQAECDKMHRVAAEAQSRVEKYTMGGYSEVKGGLGNQCSQSLSLPVAKTDRRLTNISAGGNLPHTTKFLSKHPICTNTAVENVPSEETTPIAPEIPSRPSNVAALEAMKQQLARDIHEQVASTRAALREMEVCSSTGKTLEEEEEELRRLQMQFAARSSEMDAAMNESRARLQELLAPAAFSSYDDNLRGFEERKTNQEPTIFDATALVNELIAQAEKAPTYNSHKQCYHGNTMASDSFLSGDNQDPCGAIGFEYVVRDHQPAREAQSTLYKRWTADRSLKMAKLANYRDQQVVLQAQKSMQTFQQTLAEMRGQR